MTIVTPLPNGTKCTVTTMQDHEDEIRIHAHDDPDGDGVTLVGLRVRSAKLGVIYEQGMIIAADCDQRERGQKWFKEALGQP